MIHQNLPKICRTVPKASQTCTLLNLKPYYVGTVFFSWILPTILYQTYHITRNERKGYVVGDIWSQKHNFNTISTAEGNWTTALCLTADPFHCAHFDSDVKFKGKNILKHACGRQDREVEIQTAFIALSFFLNYVKTEKWDLSRKQMSSLYICCGKKTHILF